ncbi:unnamed protein product, partial [Brassica oleracea]
GRTKVGRCTKELNMLSPNHQTLHGEPHDKSKGKEVVMFGWISPKSHIPIPSSSSYAHDSFFCCTFFICL